MGDDTITYDAQGNPLSYRGHTLTWEKGRQLKQFDDIQYTYNANGIRTSKTIDGVRHDYLLDGAKILREAWNYDVFTGKYADVLVPLYDNEDTVCGIIYNGTPYYFQKNQQGDIVAIFDANCDVVARYTYDAWGKVTAITGTNLEIAYINPFRYRGYYFDRESELYYLQSRYYDPETGRFVNGDEVECATFDTSSVINNIYCYCCNDSVNEIDCTGNIVWKIVEKIIIGISTGLISQFCIDSIEWAFKYYFIDKNTVFKPSDPEDYIVSVLSAIVDEFKPSNRIAFAASAIGLIIKYLPKVVCGRMYKKDWLNLLLDIVKCILTTLLRKSLKKLKGKISSLKKQRSAAKSDSIIKRLSKKISNLNLKIKYKGIVVDIAIPYVHQLISSIINIACPAE